MRFAVDIHKSADIQMGVSLRRAELRVAQQFLNHAQIGAGAEQMGRERVPQRVRTDALRHTRRLRIAAHDPIDASRRQSCSTEVQK